MFIKKRLIFIIIGILVISLASFNALKNFEKSISVPVFYVANAGDGTISEINFRNRNVVGTIDLGIEQLSHGIAISPDETTIYYGTGFQGKSLHSLNVQTKKVEQEVRFKEGIHGIDIHPSGRYLYVSLMSGLGQEGGHLSVIDTLTFEELANVSTGDGPAHVSVSNDGSQIWVANVNGNSISVVDAYTYQILATIPVGEVPNEVALSPSLDYAFVANVKSNSLTVINMQDFTVLIDLEVGKGVHGVTVSPDGKQVWTANNHSKDVSVIDVETLSMITTIETGSFANHISFSPDGKFAFVTQRDVNNLVVINTNEYEIMQEFELGKEPHEMTLKGMGDLKNIDSDLTLKGGLSSHWNEKSLIEREVFLEGVEVKVRILSPFVEEDILFSVSNLGDIDPSKYFIVKVDMTTHSGNLTSIPFTERTFLSNDSGDQLQVKHWIVVSNDSHHPQFLALFEKTINKIPLLKEKETKMFFEITPLINKDLMISF